MRKEYSFNENDITYVVTGGNTYKIKDELKMSGFRYDKDLGWHSPDILPVPDGYTLIPLYYNNLYDENGNYTHSANIVKELDGKPKYPESDFFGTIGERIRSIPSKIIETREMDSAYGLKTCVTFESGKNIFTWYTTSAIVYDYAVGDTIFLTGTIKDHRTIRNSKITLLNRCILKPIA